MSDQRLKAIEARMGRDLRLDYRISGGFFEDAELSTLRRSTLRLDLELVSGIDAFVQAVANRLKTRRGELLALGHPDYGSRHHELVGEPNVPRTRNLIKLYVLQALRQEPKIAKVLQVSVTPEHEPPRDSVRIALRVMPTDSDEAVNLVLPFSLQESQPAQQPVERVRP